LALLVDATFRPTGSIVRQSPTLPLPQQQGLVFRIPAQMKMGKMPPPVS